jgi:hypothetical protein
MVDNGGVDCQGRLSAGSSSPEAAALPRAEWCQSAAGRQRAEDILLLQFQSGGWPKNIRMSAPLGEEVRGARAQVG